MDEFNVVVDEEEQRIDVAHQPSSAMWGFKVEKDVAGRRRLSPPSSTYWLPASPGPELTASACRLAREAAMKAGWIDP